MRPHPASSGARANPRTAAAKRPPRHPAPPAQAVTYTVVKQGCRRGTTVNLLDGVTACFEPRTMSALMVSSAMGAGGGVQAGRVHRLAG